MKRVGPAWRLAMLAALVVLTSASALAASGYYRWTDDAGKVQFTQQPPAGRPYQFIRTSTGTAEANQPGTPVAAPSDGSPEQPTQPIGAFQGVPAKDPVQCEQARTNLSVLSGSARIRAKGDDGEYRYLTPEEIDGQEKLAKEAVDVFCG